MFQDILHSNKENSSVSWNASLSCPEWPQIMQICISFQSRSDLVLDADHSLDVLGAHLVCSVSDKTGAFLLLHCLHKNAIAHVVKCLGKTFLPARQKLRFRFRTFFSETSFSRRALLIECACLRLHEHGSPPAHPHHLSLVRWKATLKCRDTLDHCVAGHEEGDGHNTCHAEVPKGQEAGNPRC